MSEFIDKLPSTKTIQLLNRMKISESENVLNAEVSARGGKLYVLHGKDKQNNYVESIYTDFLIIKIYNSTPSEYDQQIFQNEMMKLCGPAYCQKCKQFNKNRGEILNEDFTPGEFGDEEEIDDVDEIDEEEIE